MRKQVFGKQLGRDINERKALFKTLASSLVLSEHIRTTEGKAKAIRPYIEKLVTKARKGGLRGERLIEPYLTKDAAVKMFVDIAPRFADRPGGYVRIIHAGNRIADNAEMVLMEWVEKTANSKSQIANSKKEKVSKTRKGKEIAKTQKKEAKPPTSQKSRTTRKEKKV